MRRPTPSRSRKRASVIVPRVPAFVDEEPPRVVVGGARDGEAVADADESSLLLEERASAGSPTFTGSRPSSRFELRRRGLSARRASRRPRAGRASRLAARARAAGRRRSPTASDGSGDPGVERISGVETALESRRGTRRATALEKTQSPARSSPSGSPSSRWRSDESRTGDVHRRRNVAALEQLDSLGARMAWRGGIDHAAAPDRGFRPQNDAIPSRGRRRVQLRRS